MASARQAVGIAFLVLAGAAGHADAAAPDDDAYPLRLGVGESVALCSTGTLLCPAGDTRCDDPSVVAPRADERGPVLEGVKPGTTACSAGSASGLGVRRVYRVTVVAREERGR